MSYLVKYVKYYKREKEDQFYYKQLPDLANSDLTIYNKGYKLVKLKDIISAKDPNLELSYSDLIITRIFYLI